MNQWKSHKVQLPSNRNSENDITENEIIMQNRVFEVSRYSAVPLI